MHLSPFFVRTGSPRPRLGFTLIELLVVVAIIVLLIAILLPSLGRAKSKARMVICLTHLRGIGEGFGTYSADYTNSLPIPIISLTARQTGTFALSIPWQLGLWQYTTHINLTNTQINTYAVTTTTSSTFLLNTVFVCPQGILDPRSQNYANAGYAMNSDLPNAPSTDTAVPSNWNRLKEIQPLINPSETMYAADADQYAIGVNAVGNKAIDAMGFGGIVTSGQQGYAFDAVAAPANQNRHNFCVNMVMGDGSASSKQWWNSREIPSYISGEPEPTVATLMTPAVQLFWYGSYSPGSEFDANVGGL
jgi:prepilin-type N-terminal cleavage/methylation domain-containing protein